MLCGHNAYRHSHASGIVDSELSERELVHEHGSTLAEKIDRALVGELKRQAPAAHLERDGEPKEINRPVRRRARITLDETGALDRRAELRAEPDQRELGTP